MGKIKLGPIENSKEWQTELTAKEQRPAAGPNDNDRWAIGDEHRESKSERTDRTCSKTQNETHIGAISILLVSKLPYQQGSEINANLSALDKLNSSQSESKPAARSTKEIVKKNPSHHSETYEAIQELASWQLTNKKAHQSQDFDGPVFT